MDVADLYVKDMALKIVNLYDSATGRAARDARMNFRFMGTDEAGALCQLALERFVEDALDELPSGSGITVAFGAPDKALDLRYEDTHYELELEPPSVLYRRDAVTTEPGMIGRFFGRRPRIETRRKPIAYFSAHSVHRFDG